MNDDDTSLLDTTSVMLYHRASNMAMQLEEDVGTHDNLKPPTTLTTTRQKASLDKDPLIEAIGGNGLWQMLVYLFSSLAIIPHAWQMLGNKFHTFDINLR